MIPYKPVKYREMTGNYKGFIVAVEVLPNDFYDEKYANSTKDVLDISFQFDDPENGDPIMFTQRFVAPLTEGKGLFQQLIETAGYLPDKTGGEFDEQKLVGLSVVATFGKNKKGYPFVETVVKDDSPINKPEKKEDDLPFN